MTLRRLLVANRGEIALRVVRACRELGIESVVVHSSADADSAAVRLADAAVHIGPPPPRASYLHIPNIVEAALHSGADAVHPGYGFLSEDCDFAEVCADAGLTFVGPPPRVMQRLGDKSAARAAMAAAGLPLLPGTVAPVATARDGARVARDIGYPVIIKAVAGGGGRGMAVVHRAGDFARAFAETTAAAHAVFRDGRVYVERYLTGARHVEIQVLCDAHGAGVHLGERDCSVQRRHQKLIEETPSTRLTPRLRAQMGAAAVDGALAVGYRGAGTMEFLVDDAGRFSFMEMNCRIQVEHPVTEMVTGIDLVREQLRVAAGEPLGYGQDAVALTGAAVECRINAEDPARGFAPTPGLLDVVEWPAGPWTRVDTGYASGSRVSPHYDSLLAKVVTWGPDRAQALNRMQRALAELRVQGRGVATTTDFHRRILRHPAFRAGTHSLRLVEELADGTTTEKGRAA